MKRLIADFLEVEESQLKPIFYSTIIAILATPIVYNIVFAPIGWWIK